MTIKMFMTSILKISQTVCLSVCLSVCLFVCLSVCLSVSVFLSVCLSVCLSVSLFVCLSVCLSVRLSLLSKVALLVEKVHGARAPANGEINSAINQKSAQLVTFVAKHTAILFEA